MRLTVAIGLLLAIGLLAVGVAGGGDARCPQMSDHAVFGYVPAVIELERYKEPPPFHLADVYRKCPRFGFVPELDFGR